MVEVQLAVTWVILVGDCYIRASDAHCLLAAPIIGSGKEDLFMLHFSIFKWIQK